MSETNYYKILGIGKNASDAEIKKAYRKMAMKYHPDQTKGNKSAEEKFKSVSEAYAVLSDKEKRQQYDTFGSTGFHQRYSQEDIFRGFDLGDILKEFGFGGTSRFKGAGNGIRFSFGPESPFGHHQRRPQAPVKGADLVYELPLTLQEVASGTRKMINFQHGGRSENLTVKIPKGMITGKKLRLAGKGDPSPYGGPPGDLFIRSKLIDYPPFSANGYDLTMKREIKLSEALLGTKLSIPTIEKKAINLTIPPGTKHKTKMRLPGMGLAHMNAKEKGDLYILIHINIPEQLTAQQKKLIKELAKTGL